MTDFDADNIANDGRRRNKCFADKGNEVFWETEAAKKKQERESFHTEV